MPWNDGHMTIDENAKAFNGKVTHDKYEIAVGTRCDQCLRLFSELGTRKCKQKEKHNANTP